MLDITSSERGTKGASSQIAQILVSRIEAALPDRPGIGNRLFEELAAFDPFFADLDPGLRSEFVDFENGMARFTLKYNALVGKFLALMSLYFLQFRIQDQGANFYSKFVRLLPSVPASMSLATLNYDLLLEEALIAEKILPDWGATKKVMKLHGSPNYLVMENMANSFSNVTMVNVGEFFNGPVQVTDPARAVRYCRTALSQASNMTPAISAYAVGKRVYSSAAYITALQEHFKAQTEKVDSIILVGVHLNEADEHIWQPIAASKARIGIVNPDTATYEKWGTANRRTVTNICSTADEIFDAGGSSLSSKLHRFVAGFPA